MSSPEAGAQPERAQVGELTLAVSRLGNEKVALEQSMEMEEEGIVNRLQRVIEGVMARNKAGPLAHHTPLSPSHHHIFIWQTSAGCMSTAPGSAWTGIKYLLMCNACVSISR